MSISATKGSEVSPAEKGAMTSPEYGVILPGQGQGQGQGQGLGLGWGWD